VIRNLLQFSILIILAFLLFTPTAKIIYSSSEIFQDSFSSSTLQNAWVRFYLHPPSTSPPWTNQDWHINNGELSISFNAQFVDGGIVVPNMNWKNYKFDSKYKSISGSDKNFVFRYQNSNNWYGMHANNSGIYIEKYINGSYSDIKKSNFVLQNGVYYNVSIEINDQELHIKIVNNGTELVNITHTFTGAVLENGGVGFRSATGSDGNLNLKIDDIYVNVTDTVNDLPADIHYFNQTDEPWGSQQYDHANVWNPTVSNTLFSRWGCAVTSAAMVFNYHGIILGPDGEQVTPGTLNSWLTSQKDGYLRNGATNWLALTRYARLASETNPDQTKLEFKRSNGLDMDLLDSDLDSANPAILEEPNSLGGRHFIVGTKKTDTTYEIKDPYFSELTDLSSYGNSFLGMRRFIPSNTDLSYIQLVVDQDISLTIKDELGFIVPTADSYIEQPIGAPQNGELSGQNIKTLLLPQPESGKYSVEISSDGSSHYHLQLYLYTSDGDSRIDEFHGLLGQTETETIYINYLKTSLEGTTERDISFESIMADYQAALESGLIRNIKIGDFFLGLLERSKVLYHRGHTISSKALLELALHVLKTPRGEKWADIDAINSFKESIGVLILQTF
jgi:hypothetical protein